MLVFVCDDMMSYRDPLCHALIELGHEVYSASNGEEIMDAIETPPDILFLDITMPVMGGIETLKQFREVHDEPVIIMLASIGQEQVAKQCLALGADDYIMKSPDKAQVSKLLAERFPAWEKLAKERIPELDLADTEDNDRQPWEFKFEKTVFDIDVKFPLNDTEYAYADGMEASLNAVICCWKTAIGNAPMKCFLRSLISIRGVLWRILAWHWQRNNAKR